MARRHKRLLFGTGAALCGCMLLGLCLGGAKVGLGDIMHALAGARTDSHTALILLHIRLPRVLGAVLSGVALGLGGSLIQSVLQNPLAGPNLMGVNAGAGFAVLLCASLWPGRAGLQPAAAFAGALLTAFIVLAIAARAALSRLGVVLTGFAVMSVFTAGMNLVLLLDPDAYVGAGTFLAGGLGGITMPELPIPASCILLGGSIALLSGPILNLLSLGEERARGLGIQVGGVRLVLLGAAALLAGAAVSLAGQLGFVGLVAPHTARLLAGPDNRVTVPLAGLLGALFVCGCDTLCRALLAPWELPVGIVMSLLGGPFFLYLVLSGGRRGDA